MLIKAIDGLGVLQNMIVSGQESVTDRSGSITATATSQEMFAANAIRSGWVMQNLSVNPMHVNEDADAAVGVGFIVPANGFFPPAGFPVTTKKWNVLGTAGDKFTCKEW